MSRIAGLAFSLLLLATTASQVAAITITTDTVLGPDDPYPGQPIIVKDGLNPPTRVTIVPGFVHNYGPRRDIYNGLIALGSSEIDMQGGEITLWDDDVTLEDHSKFHMSGGVTSVQAYDDSVVFIDPGSVVSVAGNDDVRIRINAPWDGVYEAQYLVLRDRSHARVLDGRIRFHADGGSAVIDDGQFTLSHFSGGTTLISGGLFESDLRIGYGEVHLRAMEGERPGGVDPIQIWYGTLHVYGTDLHIVESGSGENRTQSIVGYLADGDPFNCPFKIYETGSVVLHEVPEPTTLVLAGCGLVAAGVYRRSLRRRRETAA